MIRKPAVANQFYPGDPSLLEGLIKELIIDIKEKEDALAVISPHAGYIYSGGTAGKTYSGINIPETAVILCPNHTGYGKRVSVMTEGEWKIPGAKIPVETEIAEEILAHSNLFMDDPLSHLREHSLEVQLPFLYFFQKKISIVPVCVMHITFNECIQLADTIAKVLKNYKRRVLLVASSDMNHYESQEVTLKKDSIAIDAILSLNPKKLYDDVMVNEISMCGMIPAVIAIAASIELGAKKGRLVVHTTSGDVNKDYSHVVGYAGIVIS